MKTAAWTLFKKHGALPVLALALILLIAIGASTYADKDNATFQLKDLAGSRDAIADVVISGELRDGYHSTHFRVENGKLRTETEIFRQPVAKHTYSDFGEVLDPSERTTYTVSAGETGDIDIMSYTWKDTWKENTIRTNIINMAAVTPSIHYKDRPIYTTKSLTDGLAKIGDKVFFTPVLINNVTGTSGIYLLNFGPWLPTAPPKSTQIVEISLDANKSAEQPNIAVLGLEAVGGKLVLLTVENDELVIRSYDSVSGKVLGEAAVPDFRLADPTGIKPTDPPGTYDAAYEDFMDSRQRILNLDFKGSSGRRLMLSLSFSDGVQVVNSVLAEFSEDGGETSYGTSYLSYRNGKLYAIESFLEPLNDDNAGALKRPEHLYLYVYQQAKLIYHGELVTDWNDDREFDLQGGQDNDLWMDNRYWDHVSID